MKNKYSVGEIIELNTCLTDYRKLDIKFKFFNLYRMYGILICHMMYEIYIILYGIYKFVGLAYLGC